MESVAYFKVYSRINSRQVGSEFASLEAAQASADAMNRKVGADLFYVRKYTR